MLTGTLNGRALEFPLADDDLTYVLDMLELSDRNVQTGQVGVTIGKYLEMVPVLQAFGDRPSIAADSEAGRRLLQTCRDFSGDPFELEPWLRRVAGG